MAAMHLLPRELLHMLGSSSRASPTRHHHLDSVLALQWPRFKSDYRKVDTAVAREFDRPMEGYAYPGSDSKREHVDESSFMEENTEEYNPSYATKGRAVAGREEVSVTSALEAGRAGIQSIALARAIQCAEAGDLTNAVSWLHQTPKPSGPRAIVEHQKAVRDLQVALLAAEARNLDLLVKFALTLAARGFALHTARRPLLSHLARFSNFERLRPFWISYSAQARQYLAGTGFLARIRLEKHLDTTANAMIRAQCLAARYVDAFNFLKHIRNEQIRGMHYFATSTRNTPVATIEEFTYTLMLEELSRHKAHPQLLEDVLSLAKQDWPEPIFSPTTPGTPRSWKASRPESTFVRTRKRYYEFLSEISAGRLPSRLAALNLGRALRRTRGVAALPALLNRSLANRNSKAGYFLIVEEIHAGNQPSPNMVEKFMEICRREGADYLVQAMQRKLALPEVRIIFNRLKARIKAGETPSAEELRMFVEKCRHSRSLLLAKKLGDWMVKQGTRYKSLWFVARMHRLVKLGQPRRALHLYFTEFSTIGLPNQLLAYLNTSFGVRPLEETAKLWPSSHGITLALQAWFLVDPSYLNVQSTYTSFLRCSYDSPIDSVTMPLSILPDQVSYQAFLKPLVDLDKPEEALQVMRDMRDRGISPNQHNWDTVLGGFAKTGNEKMVRDIVARMVGALELQKATSTAISAVETENTKDVESSKPFGTRFPSFFSSASSLTVDSTIDTPAVANPSLFEGFTFEAPTIVTYATAIRGFCLANKPEAALFYKQQMYEARNADGGRIYKWGENPKADKALAILASMEQMQSQGKSMEERRSYELAPSLRR